jgi:hypothetical protein
VAIYLDIRLRTEHDDLDDALGDDIGGILDLVEGRLKAEGFCVASSTGNGVLGVRRIPVDPAGGRRGRGRALKLALELHDALTRRPTADGRVHTNLCLHAAEALVRSAGTPEIMGGPLIRTDRWAPHDDVDDLCATPEALQDLSGYELARGPGSLLTVTRCTSP